MSGLHTYGPIVVGGIAISQGVVATTDATTYTVLAANSGKMHAVPDLTADCTFTLPAAADGLSYTFMYSGAAADAHAWVINTAATDELYAGGVVFLDHNIGGAGIEVLSVYADFSNDDTLTIDLPEAGTEVSIVSDGTSWLITGTVVSDTAPVFA
jgi:hypothetical protein